MQIRVLIYFLGVCEFSSVYLGAAMSWYCYDCYIFAVILLLCGWCRC